jgi:DNA excision repair protein ERCC-4
MKAVMIGLEAGDDPEDRTFSTGPSELIRTIPGVTNKNAAILTIETKNIQEVANMTLEDLDPLVGVEHGRQIVRFFKTSVFDDE